MKRASILALALTAACALPAATKIGGVASSSGVILKDVAGVPGTTGPSTSHHVLYDAGLKRWFVFAVGKQGLRAASSSDFVTWQELTPATIAGVTDMTASGMDVFPAGTQAAHVALSGSAMGGSQVIYLRAAYDAKSKLDISVPILVASSPVVVREAPAVAPDSQGFVHVFSDVAPAPAPTDYITTSKEPFPVAGFTPDQTFTTPIGSPVHDLESNLAGDGAMTALWEDTSQGSLHAAEYTPQGMWVDVGASMMTTSNAGDWGVCEAFLLQRETNGDFTFLNGFAGQASPPAQFPSSDLAAAGVVLACGETEVVAAVIAHDGNIVTSTFDTNANAWTDWTAVTKAAKRRIGLSASRDVAGESAAIVWTEIDESVTPAVWDVRGALVTVR